MLLTQTEVADFREIVWGYFHEHAREMPWRDDPSPYNVMVSELMLQQTQVVRVIPKFYAFVREFPDVKTLAAAPLAQVLRAWNGLGYNRRAKFLHAAAQHIVTDAGIIPNTLEGLMVLPGIGLNTAGAIMCYAYEFPVAFIETNIRTVFLHHFFADEGQVADDRTLRRLVEQTLDREHPREWYWALMDYGTYLKMTIGGLLQQSAQYKKQSPLKGSLREIRGRIIKHLALASCDESRLELLVEGSERFSIALDALHKEGFIEQANGVWSLTGGELPS